jgi:hypothetical protein
MDTKKVTVREFHKNETLLFYCECPDCPARRKIKLQDLEREIGEIVLSGPSQDLATNPQVKKAYLGGM